MNRLKKLNKYLIENKIEILVIILLAVFFYLEMVNSGIATHDELQNIYLVRTGCFFQNLTWERWGIALLNAIPSYIHALCTSQWSYRIFTMVGLLGSSIAFCIFIKKIVGNKISLLIFIFFFLFAQFGLDHNGFFSFAFTYQLNICYVLCGLSVYYEFLRNRKKSYLICSAFLYLLSAMAYEAFILFGALFFLLDLMYWIDEKKLSILALFKDLILHASLVIIYVISYFIIRSLSGIENGDASFGTGIKLNEIIVTTLKLAVGLFPLNYSQYSLRDLIIRSFELSASNLVRWILIAGVMFVIYKVVVKSEQISLKKYSRITLICLCGMILPGVLVALTNKFINWIYYGGIKSFGVSYYSYFFIVAWLAITLVFLYQKLPIKKIFLIVSMLFIAFVTEFTYISNEVVIKYLAEQQDKYDLYCGLVETEYFSMIEQGAQIYAPDYIGIHYNMDTLGNYANSLSGTSISFTNEESSLNYDGCVYYLSYDSINDALFLSQIDQNGYTNEVFIYTLEGLNGYGIIADREDFIRQDGLYVNGHLENIYDTEIITGDIDVDDNYACIQCGGIIAESFEIYKTSGKYENGIIHTSGIYGQEEWGRWAEKDFTIEYNNTGKEKLVDLDCVIATPATEGATVCVTCGDYSEEIVINGATEVHLQIPTVTGKNQIRFLSSASNVIAEGDPRSMNIQIFDMKLSVDNIMMKISDL